MGHSASGTDIANQISNVSQLPLIVCEKYACILPAEPSSSTITLPEISEFILENRSVKFTNGHVETNVDSVIFCTGYMYSYPFLKSLWPPVVSDGNRVQNIYQQIFYHPIPTLSFIGLPQRIIPLPVSEGQSALIARIFSGRLSLPSEAHMQSWEEEYLDQTGEGKVFHNLAFPLDATYINMLHNRSASAVTRIGLENDGKGKLPPYWGEKEQWVRERFPLIKEASLKLGAERHKVTTLEELGFDFKEWKKGNEVNVAEPRL